MPPIPAKLVAKIQKGDFLDMAELLQDNMEAEKRRGASKDKDIAADDLKQPSVFHVTIKQSKMDLFHKGVDLFVGKTGSLSTYLHIVKLGQPRSPHGVFVGRSA